MPSDPKNLSVLGQYNLNMKDFSKFSVNYSGFYGEGKEWYLPFYLSHPTLIYEKGLLYVTYPIDNAIYLYEVNGALIDIIPGATSKLKVGRPDRIGGSSVDARELSRSYSFRNSYFGSFVYHPQLNCFFRAFQFCNPGASGMCEKKGLYIIQFDENLEAQLVIEIADDGFAA